MKKIHVLLLMFILVLVVFLFTYCSISNRVVDSDLSRDRLNGNVKKVEVRELPNDNSDGEHIFTTVYENGRWIERSFSKSNDDTYYYTSRFVYDDKDRLIKIRVQQTDEDYDVIYKYNEDNKVKEILQDSKTLRRTMISYEDDYKVKVEDMYDSKGNKLRHMVTRYMDDIHFENQITIDYVNDEELRYEITCIYDEKKNLIKTISINNDNKKVVRDYINDKYTNPIKMITTKEDGVQSVILVRYKYDRHKNWIEREMEKNNSTFERLVRTITYK